MNVVIPLYVEEHKGDGDTPPAFTVRPLFFAGPSRRDELLGRAMSKLAGDLRKLLEGLGRQMRHEELAEHCFSPPALREHRVALRLELRRSTVQCKLTIPTFEALDRRIAVVPAAGGLWFDVPAGAALADRAAEVVSAHLRRLEKENDGESLDIGALQARGWLSSVELDIHPNQVRPKEVPQFLMLGGPEVSSGREELDKVGRCLDWQYPDDLDRAILRDAEVEELTRLLQEPDRRPVLLVGPRMAGKTAVVHEYTFRRVAKLPSPYVLKQNVWLLSPQRLVSGMMYVGQWENRLLAILAEARKRDHVLYFDDLLGLYAAGLTRDSDLSVAHVLRPYVERREVRILAEMTPEALRVLRERDRGLADAFHVLPVNEPAPAQSRRILIESTRRLEGTHRCRFELDALPAATDLLTRYAADAAMPGKAAALLRRLALKHRGEAVTRDATLNEFHASSGLSVRFLDDRQRLERGDVVDALRRELIGQDAAVAAMADAVCVAKARLNDSGRPLASLLFLGPTGVGKTQAAKALAAYLFGDARRLVRFDMNEYPDPRAAARLVGTFVQPEGLLTTAVRRQPFCVLLLDEIEKAHPDVFDLLLQVTGEGRLTDALGRTTDFTNAIVIFTSNLGTRETANQFGLRPTSDGANRTAAADHARRDTVFTAAAERFFRPEFFNRLDRLVPFRRLSRDDVRLIADSVIRGVFRRDGLLQRKCVLQIDPAAMGRVIDQGFDPDLGARALKRAVEKQLTRPIAARLATMAPGTPTLISVHPGREGVVVHTQALTSASRVRPRDTDLSDPWRVLERVEDAVDRIERSAAEGQAQRPLTQGQIGPGQFRYLAVREQASRVRILVRRAFDRLDAPRHVRVVGAGHASPRLPRSVGLRRLSATDSDEHALWRAFAAAEQVNQYLADLAESAQPLSAVPDQQVRQAVQEAAVLDAMAAADAAAAGGDRVLIHLRALTHDPSARLRALRLIYERVFERQYGFSAVPVENIPVDSGTPGASEMLLVELPGALTTFGPEAGTHLFTEPAGDTVPIQVMLVPLAGEEDPARAAAEHAAARDRWRAALAAGDAAPDADPWPLRPVVRIYGQGSATVDLRSGLVVKGALPQPQDVRSFLLAQLTPPAEVTEPAGVTEAED